MSRTLIHRRVDANQRTESRFVAARAAWRERSRPDRLRLTWLAGYVALATLLFIEPLLALFIHAEQSDLHSHIPLIPLITAYLIYSDSRPRPATYRTSAAG